MKIKIAGAGSGKTTNLAKNIINKHKNVPINKNIFCITFTNNASDKIREKLVEYYGEIPNNIKVSTIHSFIYKEIINPYYFLLFNKQYVSISNIKLDSNPRYKMKQISELERENILHVNFFTERAKWVIYKKSRDRKKENIIRSLILDSIKSYTSHIFIDESQDIDSNFIEIIKVFDELSINIELIGDPKQDLKGTHSLRKLMLEFKDSIEYFDECYRCPQKHLNLSNTLFLEKEKQYSKKKNGEILTIFESDINLREFFETNRFDLKYISKKKLNFTTKKEDKSLVFQSLFYELNKIIKIKNGNNDLDIKKWSYYLSNKVISEYEKTWDKKNAMKVLNGFIEYNKVSYAKVISKLNYQSENVLDKIQVSSIESIKGQEGEDCLFVLTYDLAEYLFRLKKENNKTKNLLYVALTRSLNKLTILITKDVERKIGREKIISFLERYF